MARNHNVNEDYGHYQHRVHTENYVIWKFMFYFFIAMLIYAFYKYFIASGTEGQISGIVYGFIAVIGIVISYVISKFNKWKRNWSWISG